MGREQQGGRPDGPAPATAATPPGDDLVRTREGVERYRLLVAGLAHDLGNQLGVIRNYAWFVQEDHARANVAADIAEVLRTTDAAIEMVRGLRLFSGGELPERPSCTPHEVVEQLEPDLQLELGVGNLTLELSAPGRSVGLEREALTHVLLALVTNARDAGACCLRIAVRQVADGVGHALQLEVGDDGAGMDPEVLRRAVLPFWSTRRAAGRRGLGLPGVATAAERAGGHLELESTPGVGTRAVLHLPVLSEVVPAAASPSALTSHPAGDCPGSDA